MYKFVENIKKYISTSFNKLLNSIREFIIKDKQCINDGKVKFFQCLYVGMFFILLMFVFIIFFVPKIINDYPVLKNSIIYYYLEIISYTFGMVGIYFILKQFRFIPYLLKTILLVLIIILISPVIIIYILMIAFLKILYNDNTVYETFYIDWYIIVFTIFLFMLEFVLFTKYYQSFLLTVIFFIFFRLFLLFIYIVVYKMAGESLIIEILFKKVIILTVIDFTIYYIVYLFHFSSFCDEPIMNYIKDFITLFTLVLLFADKRKNN